ncbi:MAG: hypothetical protein HQL03_01935 [Nitrospirae bacterium]|nr:hypothetical protein [Nitrospirota bacterium]MBF0591300.1 hypothetical protein [Nitrospirota bacterium]
MIIVKSKNNISLRLTKERWVHIVLRHPELKGQKDQVIETVLSPYLIQEGDFGELIAFKHYNRTPLTSKYLVVVYKEPAHKLLKPLLYAALSIENQVSIL